jgi:hypothetical protein
MFLSQPAQTPRDCNRIRAATGVSEPQEGVPQPQLLESYFDVLARGVAERPVQSRVFGARDVRDERESRRVQQIQRRVATESGVAVGVCVADHSQHRHRVGA